MIENTPLLNTEIINELLDVIGDGISEVLKEFQSSSMELMATARTAYSSKDTETLINCIHSLKGAAGNIGLQKLFESCLQLEMALRNHDETDVNDQLDKIQNEYFQTISELKTQGLIN